MGEDDGSVQKEVSENDEVIDLEETAELQFNPEELEEDEEYAVSLKDTAESYEARIRWSQEIEGELLTKSIETAENIASRTVQSPMSYIPLIADESNNELYPSVQGFAPINYKNYTAESRAVVEKFCSALVKGNYLESLMKANRLYELMVFKYNLEKINKLKLKYAGYLLGEPFVSEDTFQCPVRIFYDTASYNGDMKYKASGIDFFIYLEKGKDGYKIVQLSFMPKEKSEENDEAKKE